MRFAIPRRCPREVVRVAMATRVRSVTRDGGAGRRGRRRRAYEAPNGLVAPGPVSSGAESKRRRCPRSRARQSRVGLLAEVPHAEQHGPAGKREEPIGGGDGRALLAECQAPRYIEKQAARGGGAHPERPSDRETPRPRDPYPAGGDHDSSKIQGAADVEEPVHEEEPGAEEPVAHHQIALAEREG